MQLLSNQYGYQEILEQMRADWTGHKLDYQTVEELYVSPAVKSTDMADITGGKRIKEGHGRRAQEVFLEVAREKMESGRTVSMKKHLKDLYLSCKSEERNWLAELDRHEEHSYRSDRLFLYYTPKKAAVCIVESRLILGICGM